MKKIQLYYWCLQIINKIVVNYYIDFIKYSIKLVNILTFKQYLKYIKYIISVKEYSLSFNLKNYYNSNTFFLYLHNNELKCTTMDFESKNKYVIPINTKYLGGYNNFFSKPNIKDLRFI